MTISMYSASVPLFVRGFDNLIAILQKGADFAAAKKIEPSVLVGSRLIADMLPLSKQIQIATDISKGCVARLAGVEVPKYEDNETNFEELIARLKKTSDFVKSLKPEQVDGSEDKIVTLPTQRGPQEFKGLPYLTMFVLPNFYFHSTAAYAILRKNGVELGKQDFLGKLF